MIDEKEIDDLIMDIIEFDGDWAAFKDGIVVFDVESGMSYICEIKSKRTIE